MQNPRPLPVDPPSAADVDRSVRSVFEDTDLRRALEPRSTIDDTDWVRTIFDWVSGVFDWFDDISQWILDLRYTSPLLYVVVVVAMLLVLALLIWHIAFTVRVALTSRDPSLDVTDEDGRSHRRRRFQSLHEEARSLAARGETREAARTLLLALLALLEERKTLRVARGWTTREVLSRLSARVGHRDELQTFAATIERTTYGAAVVDSATFEHLDQSIGSLALEITSKGTA